MLHIHLQGITLGAEVLKKVAARTDKKWMNRKTKNMAVHIQTKAYESDLRYMQVLMLLWSSLSNKVWVCPQIFTTLSLSVNLYLFVNISMLQLCPHSSNI
jgi:hypothetical protein